MKKFTALFIGSENSLSAQMWEALDDQTRRKREEEGKTAWMNWVKANSKSIVEMGSPLGVTLQINPHGISSITNKVTAYTVVQAESHEAAAKLFLNHPHFSIFPGDSVEVMECLPIPGM